MLSGPQQKFVEGIVSGLTDGDAYAAAYPKSKHPGQDAARLRSEKNPKKPEIDLEITRLRKEAENLPGSAVLTLAEKRQFLRDVVMTPPAEIDERSALCQSYKVTEDGREWKMPDKLKAIALDNDLAGDGSEAGQQDTLTELMKRIVRHGE